MTKQLLRENNTPWELWFHFSIDSKWNALVHFQQTKLKHFNYDSFTQNSSFHNIFFFYFFPFFRMEMHFCFICNRNFGYDYVLCRLQDYVLCTLRKEPSGIVYTSNYACRKLKVAPRELSSQTTQGYSKDSLSRNSVCIQQYLDLAILLEIFQWGLNS